MLIASASAQDTTNYPTLGEIVRLEPQLDALIPSDARIEVLAGGFDWSEGPVWVPRDGGYLLFSDIPRNSIMQWVPGRGVSLFLKPSGYTGKADYGAEPGSNGLSLDPDGNLVCCEHGDRRMSRMTWDGGKRTLVDSYQGRRLNSPNDAVWHKNGDLYFTDPPYGLPERWEDPRRELDFCGVYRLTSSGELKLLTKEMTRPNGIGLSPDQRTLYVAQSDPDAALWKSFPLNSDGSLAAGRTFYDVTAMVDRHKGLPDGMAIDAQGNIFATGPGGVFIFTPQGTLLGRIDTKEATANCCFGGPDGSTLFITADMWLCRVETTTKGLGM
jgi:gluconolactonase